MFLQLKSSRTPQSHTDERRSSTASTSSSSSNWTSSSLHTSGGAGGDHQSVLAESSSSICSDTVSENTSVDYAEYYSSVYNPNTYYHAMMAAQTIGSHGEQKQLYDFHQRKLEERRHESRRQSSASERSCERLTVGDCKQLWKCMIELQERYGCYHSTRIDLAVEAGDAGLLNYMPNRFIIDTLNESVIDVLPEEGWNLLDSHLRQRTPAIH